MQATFIRSGLLALSFYFIRNSYKVKMHGCAARGKRIDLLDLTFRHCIVTISSSVIFFIIFRIIIVFFWWHVATESSLNIYQ